MMSHTSASNDPYSFFFLYFDIGISMKYVINSVCPLYTPPIFDMACDTIINYR